MNFFHLLLLLLLAIAWTANARSRIECRGTIFCSRPNFEYKLSMVEFGSEDELYEDSEFIAVTNGSHQYRAASCTKDWNGDNYYVVFIDVEHNCNPQKEMVTLSITAHKFPVGKNKVIFINDVFLPNGPAYIKPTSIIPAYGEIMWMC